MSGNEYVTFKLTLKFANHIQLYQALVSIRTATTVDFVIR